MSDFPTVTVRNGQVANWWVGATVEPGEYLLIPKDKVLQERTEQMSLMDVRVIVVEVPDAE